MQRSDHLAALTPESRYRLLVDAIIDYAIYMLDLDGKVASWNPGAQRFKGYEAAEIIGQNFARFYTEEDQASGLPMRALHTAAVEGRYEQEGWRVRKDGSRFWAHVVIDPILAPTGELLGYAKVTRDLSERRQAELALRRSEDQFRLLVKGVTDYAIYMLDLDGRVASWNFGAERIKGYRPEEIIGRHFSSFYTDDDRIAGLPGIGLTAALRDGRFETEGWRLRKDGTRFWAHVVIDAIPDDSGEVIGFAKVTRDVTERQAAQHALELAREALFQSQKIEAIGQLTGGVAHDFNNLLMAILGSLELARKRLPDDPRLARLIDNAVQGAERGASLTQRMLAFARRQELRREAVALPDLVAGMAGLLERSLGPSVDIHINFPDRLPLVLSDANQLESALLNLAVNARDAMPGGGIIRVGAAEATLTAAAADLAPGHYICLSVTDNGEGMDAQTMARATEPFFTTKGIGKGTGLGLPMVHGMAQQSGGALRLKSKLGKGTTIELWLPVADAGLVPTPAKPVQTAASSRPITVLAVDDDALVLINTAAMLEDLGHIVLQADGGIEALEILRREPGVELVITDQAMPRMTGAQLAEAVMAERPGVTVILATGYAELPPGTGVGLRRLAKPFSQAELAQVIDEIAAGEDR
jgi:PAS domain S-box-containing protein